MARRQDRYRRAHGEPLARTRSGSPSAPMAGPRRQVPGARRVMQHSPRDRRARRRARRRWEALFADTDKKSSELATEIARCNGASCRRVGPQPAELFARSQGHRRTPTPRRGAERARPEIISLVSRARPTSDPRNKTTLKFAGAATSEADSPGGRNLHFGIREHAWRRSSTGCRSPSCGRSERPSQLQRLCPPAIRTVRDHGASDISFSP